MSIIDSYINFLTILQAKPEEKNTYRELFKKDITKTKIKNFDTESYLNSLGKPIIEIAGPTPQGFKTIDIKKIKQFFTSNLAKSGQNVSDNPQLGNWRDYVGSSGEIDFQADGQNMPLMSESVGGVLISAILNEKKLNENIIDEANRILVHGGILILEANTPDDVLYAINHGFEVIKYQRKIENFFEPFFNIVLKKKG